MCPLPGVCQLDLLVMTAPRNERGQNVFATSSGSRDKTGRMWPNLELSERVQNTREYVLRQFWQIFVEDRLLLRDATLTHTHVQPKLVFSCATAVMDEIEG